jgi:hypothetical protein
VVGFLRLINNKLRAILRTLPLQPQALKVTYQRPLGTSALVGVPTFLSVSQQPLFISEVVVGSAHMRWKG